MELVYIRGFTIFSILITDVRFYVMNEMRGNLEGLQMRENLYYVFL